MIWLWLTGAWASHALAPALYLRRRVIYGSMERAELALTFDDGPDPRYTPLVMDILNRYGVEATFFVVGARARRHPELLRAIAAAGHDLGNHSYAHFPPWFQPPLLAYMDHLKTNDIVAEVVGRVPAFARAPWGAPNAGQWWATARSGQSYVHWTVHAYDWKPGISPGEICARVLRQVAPGGIAVLHDGSGFPGSPKVMVEALPRLISQLQERFRLVPLRHWLPIIKGPEVLARDVDSLDLGSV